MDTPAQHITRLISQACIQYPGGLRAVFKIMQENENRKRSEATLYSDFNPNESSLGNLKVCDLLAAIKITGDREVLRYIAALFGYCLTSIYADEPDAPTIEAEMLQDYPAVVAFHEAIQAFDNGKADYPTVLAKLDAACTELRQTAAMARKDIGR